MESFCGLAQRFANQVTVAAVEPRRVKGASAVVDREPVAGLAHEYTHIFERRIKAMCGNARTLRGVLTCQKVCHGLSYVVASHRYTSSCGTSKFRCSGVNTTFNLSASHAKACSN